MIHAQFSCDVPQPTPEVRNPRTGQVDAAWGPGLPVRI